MLLLLHHLYVASLSGYDFLVICLLFSVTEITYFEKSRTYEKDKPKLSRIHRLQYTVYSVYQLISTYWVQALLKPLKPITKNKHKVWGINLVKLMQCKCQCPLEKLIHIKNAVQMNFIFVHASV